MNINLSSPVLMFNIKIALVIFVVSIIFGFFSISPLVALSFSSILTVGLIIFGDNLQERFIREKQSLKPDADSPGMKIIMAILSRESLLPLSLILGLLSSGYIATDNISSAVVEKFDIIFLILTFALIAQGIGYSGYFKYAAFRVLEVCDGNTSRMILYLFILSSVLTYSTSNDIVILIMTPIIISLCHQAKIKNGKLLLLSQFVAANTVSMGLLIGSPTNIIIASEVNLNFVDYFKLMLFPSILSLVISLVLVFGINRYLVKFSKKWKRFNLQWDYDPCYQMPALKEQPTYTEDMKIWIMGFIVVVLAILTISHFNLPFFYVTLPAGLVAGYGTFRFKKSKHAMSSLPYQIIIFAFTFFAIAGALGEQLISHNISIIKDTYGDFWDFFGAIFYTGVLVNSINDLPAAALLGDILSKRDIAISEPLLQSILAGLNIACYVTPIGALAGIIWFRIMNENKGDNLLIPSRVGMLVYGLIHFLCTAGLLAISIPFFSAIQTWLGVSGEEVVQTDIWVGLIIVPILFFMFYHLLKEEKIFLGDMRAFLSAASWIKVRTSNTGPVFQLLLGLSILMLFTWLIWLAESNFEENRSFGDLLIWMISLLGAGSETEWVLETRFAKIVAAMMPIVVLYFIVTFANVIRNEQPLKKTSYRIACGEIITRRSIIVDHEYAMNPLVSEIWNSKDNNIFQTILYTKEPPPPEWTSQHDYDDIYPQDIQLDDQSQFEYIVDTFQFERADEIYLLSDKFYGDNAKNIDIIIAKIKVRMEKVNPQGLAEIKNHCEDGQEPENYAGRVPRIFIWEDGYNQISNIDMQGLFIILSDKCRDSREDFCQAIVSTADEKEWVKRRQKLKEAGITVLPHRSFSQS